MADNVDVTPGSGATIKTDELAGGVQIQCVKVDGGGDGLSVPILAGGGVEADALRVTIANDSTGVVSVDDNGSSLTVDDGGSTLSVDDGGASLGVDDNGGSLTVDAPVGTPVFVQLSDGAAPITTLPVSIAAGSASIAKAEDVASANGDVGVPAMAIQKTSPGDLSLTDGDWGFLQMKGGRLWVSSKITDGAGTALALSPDAVASLADPGLAFLAVRKATPANLTDSDGDYENPQISNGRLWVSGDQTSGDVAHDAADSGNPVKIGAKAHAPFALQAAVAADDRVNLSADLYGRLRVVSHPDDVKRLGVYYYHSGVFTVGAAADAAATSGGGRVWIINPVGSSVTRRIRKVTFRSQLGSALLAPTSPRFLLEKGTFTGTDSGTAITPTQRRTSDASPVGAGRTASTGMTVSASAVVASFFPVASANASAYCPPTEQVFEPGPEDYLDLDPGECLILRQADAGTAADTRRCTCDFVVEEF